MTKNIYELYSTEDELEIEGAWKEIGNTRVKIARTGNKNTLYSKVFKRVTKKYEKVNFEDLPERELASVLVEIFAKGNIKAWEIKDENDEWVDGMMLMNEDSEEIEIVDAKWENYKACLLQLPDFFKILREFSEEITNFQKEIEDEQLKN